MTRCLPRGAAKYAQTRTFDEASIPTALLRDHSTKPNSWGLIVVRAGRLTYTRTDQPPQTLTTDTPGVILPGELHRIAPDGPVSFHVEFYHDPDTTKPARDAEELTL